MMGLMLFNMFLFPLIATSITMPNVTNPIGDLFPGFAQSPTGTGSGTQTACQRNFALPGGPQTCENIASGQQNIQSCLIGAGTGAVTGGIVGTVVPGIGNLAGFIAGAFLGGIAGCGLASTFFPAQGSALFSGLVNSAGPLGDFMSALAIALGWVGPILKFFQDMVAYEFALLVGAPEIGVWLLPFQIVMAVMFMYLGAEYIRGSGIGA